MTTRRLGWVLSFGSIRARLILVLWVAAIPLITLTGILTWRDYQATLRDVEANAGIAREDAAAQARASLYTTRNILAVLGHRLTTASGADCGVTLHDATLFAASRDEVLALLNPAGEVVCANATAAAASVADSWRGRVARAQRQGHKPSHNTTVWSISAPDMGWMLGVAVPVGVSPAPSWSFDRMPATPSPPPAASPAPAGTGRTAATPEGPVRGTMLAALPVARLAAALQGGLREGATVWLIDPAARLDRTEGGPERALPAEAGVLDAAVGTSLIARSRAGHLMAYAAADLPDGLCLLTAYDAQDDIARARTVLLVRIVLLGALLAAAFALVAIGVHRAVVRPLRDLAAAVRRWRGGGAFVPAMPPGTPTEVVELSLAFRDATGRLAEREAQVRAALGERDLLMQEIHHRVKNNLQIVASLLNLQAGRIRQPEARAEFLSARNRVRALATLHRHLYLQGDLQRINMRSFLTELCSQLFEAMGETEGDRITVSIEASELEMASDQAVPLALIVTETVSNALKYAFPRPRRGHVSVILRAEPTKGRARLVVEDDGIGLPAGPAETDTGTRDGLGIQLIRGFARQIGATLEVTERNGTRYVLVIPLQSDLPPASGERQEAAD